MEFLFLIFLNWFWFWFCWRSINCWLLFCSVVLLFVNISCERMFCNWLSNLEFWVGFLLCSFLLFDMFLKFDCVCEVVGEEFVIFWFCLMRSVISCFVCLKRVCFFFKFVVSWVCFIDRFWYCIWIFDICFFMFLILRRVYWFKGVCVVGGVWVVLLVVMVILILLLWGFFCLYFIVLGVVILLWVVV